MKGKKDPKYSKMPMTPSETAEFKRMMMERRNTPSGPVGGEAQRTKYEERFMKLRDKFKKGGMMKYLKGGQVKLDANKDGKITGADFKALRKK
jgi:hypothetical protein